LLFFFSLLPPAHISTLFPYTTLFRSGTMPVLNPTPVSERAPVAPTQPGSFASYVAKLLVAKKGYAEGPVAETAVLTSACDFVLRSEEHTSELPSLTHLVCRLLLVITK